MKKRLILFIIPVVAVLVLGTLLFIHQNETDDDTLHIYDRLKTSYKLADLQAYFGTISPAEAIFYDPSEGAVYRTMEDAEHLSLMEIHKVFPIEYFRRVEHGFSYKGVYYRMNDIWYTVYKVAEGGCFYVMWGPCDESTDPPDGGTRRAYYTFYISELPRIGDYDEIEPGVSTAEDVSKVSNVIEMNFLMSSGPCSYSLLKDGRILEIRYVHSRFTTRQDLVVKEMRILSRDDAQSACYLVKIAEEDLP